MRTELRNKLNEVERRIAALKNKTAKSGDSRSQRLDTLLGVEGSADILSNKGPRALIDKLHGKSKSHKDVEIDMFWPVGAGIPAASGHKAASRAAAMEFWPVNTFKQTAEDVAVINTLFELGESLGFSDEQVIRLVETVGDTQEAERIMRALKG